jgi:hypothetical protein
MAVKGDFQGLPCEVITVWEGGPLPDYTVLALRPPLGISSSHHLDVVLKEEGELREVEGTVAQLPGEAREILPELLTGTAHRLELSDKSLRLHLDAPLMDPTGVYQQLGFMAQFLAAVQPNAGPYR